MADGHVALERAQLVLVEDLGDQAAVAQGHDRLVPRHGDAGGLLPAVLERVEREVRKAGDVAARRVDAEDPTLVSRPVAMVEEIAHVRGTALPRGYQRTRH